MGFSNNGDQSLKETRRLKAELRNSKFNFSKLSSPAPRNPRSYYHCKEQHKRKLELDLIRDREEQRKFLLYSMIIITIFIGMYHSISNGVDSYFDNYRTGIEKFKIEARQNRYHKHVKEGDRYYNIGNYYFAYQEYHAASVLYRNGEKANLGITKVLIRRCYNGHNCKEAKQYYETMMASEKMSCDEKEELTRLMNSE